MKKKNLLLGIILSSIAFLFFGCGDINFGCQDVYSDLLLEDVATDSEIEAWFKCEKLNAPDYIKCEESKEISSYFMEVYNLSVDKSYKFFFIPHGYQIDDHKNIKISFKVDVNGTLYKASFDIPTLNTHTGDGRDKKEFTLKADNGDTIKAVFTWDLHMTI